MFITTFISTRYLSLSKVLVHFRGLLYERFVTRYVIPLRSC